MRRAPRDRFRVETVDQLTALYEATFDEVAIYARRLAGGDATLAEDLVHDAYLSLLRSLRSGGAPAEVGVGWLITAIRNRFIDLVRSDAAADRAIQRALSGSADVTTDAVTPDVGLDLSRLEPIDRLVLVLHHADGWSVKDIAEAIGRSARATESMLARARRAARMTIAQEVNRD